MWKRVTVWGALAATLALSGCAALNSLSNDVSTYNLWPAGRKPATYVFERLPSQMTQPDQQQLLEDAARPALQMAGFTPAADAKSADVIVQLGARVTGNERSLYDDPFWWHGGLYGSRFYGLPRPYGYGFGWGFGGMGTPTYEREVALLIRDRAAGTPLYEARASNAGGSPSINSLLNAMFEAALKDFPSSGINPRRVVTQIAKT